MCGLIVQRFCLAEAVAAHNGGLVATPLVPQRGIQRLRWVDEKKNCTIEPTMWACASQSQALEPIQRCEDPMHTPLALWRRAQSPRPNREYSKYYAQVESNRLRFVSQFRLVAEDRTAPLRPALHTRCGIPIVQTNARTILDSVAYTTHSCHLT